MVSLAGLRWQWSKSASRFKATRHLKSCMSQTNSENSTAKTNPAQGLSLQSYSCVRKSIDSTARPAANLLELFHARQLRDVIEQQVVRLEKQSCVVSWGTGMAEFEPLYCDNSTVTIRDPLNGDEVRSHYTDLMVAMDHLLEQLGEVR